MLKAYQVFSPKPFPEHLAIGSVLGWGFRRDNVNVFWGSGFMFNDEVVRSQPRKICAVRGPLSRKQLLAQNIDCPEIYGDPALLFPRYYFPEIKKKYSLGVIPHMWNENDDLLRKFSNDPEVKIIDIKSGIFNVVDEILSCEYIASNSLHGLIAADAYGVPSIWIDMTQDILGDGFKFRDYLASVGRDDNSPILLKNYKSSDEIIKKIPEYKINIDLDKLYNACPFKEISGTDLS